MPSSRNDALLRRLVDGAGEDPDGKYVELICLVYRAQNVGLRRENRRLLRENAELVDALTGNPAGFIVRRVVLAYVRSKLVAVDRWLFKRPALDCCVRLILPLVALLAIGGWLTR